MMTYDERERALGRLRFIRILLSRMPPNDPMRADYEEEEREIEAALDHDDEQRQVYAG